MSLPTQRLDPGRRVVAGPRRRATRLSPVSSRGGKLLFSLAFALGWNGVVALFIGRGRVEHSILLGLFLIPFVAIGIGAIGAVVHAFLGLFNPSIEVTLGQEALVVGGSAELGWRVQGRVQRFRALELRLEGEEVAIYSDGDQTRTERRVFSRRVLGDGVRMETLRSGRASLLIPAGSMHSFSTPSNKIEWRVVVNGDIPAWPDVSESFAIDVLPAPPVAELTYRDAARTPSVPFSCAGDEALRILVADGKRSFRPGETVSGMVAWQGLSEDASRQALELQLGWRTRGKGIEDVEVVERMRVEHAGTHGQQRYAFRIPEGPHSFSGTLVSLGWELKLVVEGTKLSTRGELVVGPDAREIVLDGVGAEAEG